MVELKTLKDLEKPIGCYVGCEQGNTLVVNHDDLKQEAIKWIKELRKETKENPEDKLCDIQLFTDNKKRKCNPIGTALADSVRRETWNYITEKWIKDFFNITESDLK